MTVDLDLILVASSLIVGLGMVSTVIVQRSMQKTAANIRFLEQYDDEELPDDFQAMLNRPIRVRAMAWLRHLLTPKSRRRAGWLRSYRRRIQRTLDLAGLSQTVVPEMIIVAQLVLGLIGASVGLLAIGLLLGRSLLGFLVLIVLAGFGFRYPYLSIRLMARRRSRAMSRDLPDFIELVAMGMRAGLSVDAASHAVIQDFPGPFSDEVRRFLDEISLGTPRRQALVNLKERNDVPAVAQLVTTLIQGDEMGMPVAALLQTAAGEARLRRQQEAKEAAAKLPVKMLLPLVFCVFPPILVVILGPAIGSIRSALG